MYISRKPKYFLPIVDVPSKNLKKQRKEKRKQKKLFIFFKKHVLIMLTSLRILKTSQEVLCVRKKTILRNRKHFLWSYFHLGDTTLPISVEIQKNSYFSFWLCFLPKIISAQYCISIFLHKILIEICLTSFLGNGGYFSNRFLPDSLKLRVSVIFAYSCHIT